MAESTALQPYNFEAAMIREVGTELELQAEALVIADDAMDVAAKEVLARVTQGLKQAKARRVEIKAPALAECQAIDAAFNEATAPFEAAKATIARKAGAYHKAKVEAEEADRREAERQERAAIAAQLKAEAEAAAAGTPAPESAPMPTPAPKPASAVTKTEAGSVGMVRVRGYRITDEAQIPREFWLLDTSLVAKTYKAGGDVPGCEEDITYVPRTRGNGGNPS